MRKVLWCLLTALVVQMLFSVGVGGAQTGSGNDVVDVVEISGDLNGILASFIVDSIERAGDDGSIALVLQVDSSRTTLSDDELVELAQVIHDAPLPVTMWVGPSGAQARGGIAQLAGVADDLALAHGSRLGDTGVAVIDADLMNDDYAAVRSRLVDDTISAADAVALGIGREAPTLPFFVLDLPGFRSGIDTSGDEPTRTPLSSVRFAKLGLLDQYMHTAASPAVTYLLLLAAGVLLIFELYTAGVGIAGVVGAACLLLGCYGLTAQPFSWAGVAFLLVAAFGYCIDIQTGVPRVWTAIATVCLAIGSLSLFDGFGFDGLAAGWVATISGFVGVVLAMMVGMPAMVRARFSLPTIGREHMIGAIGVAPEGISTEGVVVIDGAPWRARATRASKIAPGDSVEVMAIEGLVLNVAPIEETEPSQPSS